MPACNERFHASGGVCPQIVLWEFASESPALTIVNRPPAVKPLGRYRQASGQYRANKKERFVTMYIRMIQYETIYTSLAKQKP